MNSIVRKMMLSTGVLLILLNLLVQQCHTSPEFEYSNYNSNSRSSLGSRHSPSSSSSPAAASPFSQYRKNQEQIHRFKSLSRVFNRLASGSGSGGGGGTSGNNNSYNSNSNSNSNDVLAGNSPVVPKFDGSANLLGNASTPSFSSGTRTTSPYTSSTIPRRFPLDDEMDEDDDDDDMDDSYEDDSEILRDKTSPTPPPWSYTNSNTRSNTNNGHAYRVPAATAPSTTTTTTTTTTTPPPMSYSQYKWQNLGSRQAVDNYRRQTLSGSSNGNGNAVRHHHHHPSGSSSSTTSKSSSSSGHYGSGSSSNSRTGSYSPTRSTTSAPQPPAPDTSIREAINHALKVSREGSCRVPKPRLVRVNDFYPHPGKTYVPHCTILHQCSDETGCCRHDVLTCSPKTTQRVELSFYTITMESNRGSTVERLVFYNHTECECRDRMEDLMPRDVSIPAGSSGRSIGYKANNNELSANSNGRVSNTYDVGSGRSYASRSSGVSSNSLSTNGVVVSRLDSNTINLHGCKCPSAYTERILPDNSCTCDCFDREKECLRLKKGRIFFTMQDKWCIQSGRCEVPGCAYGAYIHLIGRCPRRRERYGPSLSWHHYLTQ